jgi:hypothetical protein
MLPVKQIGGESTIKDVHSRVHRVSELNTNRRWRISLPIAAVVVPIVYVLSSGPVLAIAFWLRHVTRWDGFDAAMLLYYPLIQLGPHSLFENYIWWWCNLLDAMPPG